MNIQITIDELLVAVVKSELYGRSHLHFIPTGTEHQKALKKCKRLGYIKYLTPGGSLFRITRKGKSKLHSADSKAIQRLDSQIDKFVDEL